MDALQGRPRAENIRSVSELREQAMDARTTLVEGYAEGHSRKNLAAMNWLKNQGNRVPLLLGATDFEPFRPADPYHPHLQDFIAMANTILAWCDRQAVANTALVLEPNGAGKSVLQVGPAKGGWSQMSMRPRPADLLWDLQQKEIQELTKARTFALAPCNGLRRLFEGIVDDKPNWAASPIGDFLDDDRNKHWLSEALRTVGHLIELVQKPVTTPGFCGEFGRDGHLVPSILAPRKSAHDAAFWIYEVFGTYFHNKAEDCLKCPSYFALRIQKPYTWQLDAVDAIIDSQWTEIREELTPVTTFDCDAVKAAIETESRAAIEHCRSSAMQIAVPGKDGTAGEPSGDALLTHIELASHFGRDVEPTRKQLDRWRGKNADGWVEVTEPKPRESKYRYRFSAVRHLFEQA